MDSNINEYQLAKLARLSSNIINSLTVSDDLEQKLQGHYFSDFVHLLELQYQNDALLFNARCAIERLSSCQNDFFIFTRDLIRKVRGSEEVSMKNVDVEAAEIPLWNMNTSSAPADYTVVCH